jgi:phosphatidylglycerol---prolipoprotein diacylglyceryl transferase
MRPILVTWAGLPIPSYAVFVALGFAAALVVRRAEARRLGLAARPGQRWLTAAALLGAMLGAKAGMVLFEPWDRLGDLFQRMLMLDFTGKTVIGALAGAILAVEITKKALGIRHPTGDQYAVAVPLAIGLGRIGCLLNGCCYGAAGGGPVAAHMAGALRHPVQAYEAIAVLALAAWLWTGRQRPRPPGHLWRLFLVGFASIRLGLEALRGDPSLRLGPVSFVQIVCAAAILGYGMTLIRRGPPRESPTTS